MHLSAAQRSLQSLIAEIIMQQTNDTPLSESPFDPRAAGLANAPRRPLQARPMYYTFDFDLFTTQHSTLTFLLHTFDFDRFTSQLLVLTIVLHIRF